MNWQIIKSVKDFKDLKEDEVHVWYFDLEKSKKEKDLLESLLSQDELSRAGSFHFEKDRIRYICGRGILRLLISVYTGTYSTSINLCYSEFGKPELLKDKNTKSLQFNISHSEDAVVFCFAKNVNIGIDIEFLRPIANILEIANRYFTAKEFQQLNYFKGKKRIEAFYTCWVKKEAVIKAIGEGLSFPLSVFNVSPDTNEENLILSNKLNGEHLNKNIFLSGFRVSKDLTAAIAVLDNPKKISYLKLDDDLKSGAILGGR